VLLQEGYHTIRLLVKYGEHNLNWFELVHPTGRDEASAIKKKYVLYPNPGEEYTMLKMHGELTEQVVVTLFDIRGKIVHQFEETGTEFLIQTSGFHKGLYILQIKRGSETFTEKLIIR
jgi:hypothetical protein